MYLDLIATQAYNIVTQCMDELYMSTINSQGGENTFADGNVSNLAKVSLRIRTHIDMDGQCSPVLLLFQIEYVVFGKAEDSASNFALEFQDAR